MEPQQAPGPEVGPSRAQRKLARKLTHGEHDSPGTECFLENQEVPAPEGAQWWPRQLSTSLSAHGGEDQGFVEELKGTLEQVEKKASPLIGFWTKLNNDWVFNFSGTLAYGLLT